MTETRIKQLLDEASDHYNEGEFENAIETWRGVLALDPANQKAREGIRMASLLVENWEGESRGGGEGDDGPHSQDSSSPAPEEERARIAAGIARVRDLAAQGRIEEALEGCDLLAEIAPGLEDVRRLRREVPALAKPRGAEGPFDAQPAGSAAGHLATALSLARAALADGRNKEAADAATRALRLDPSNMEACGILSLAADDATAAAPVEVSDTGQFDAISPGGIEEHDGPEAEAGERAVGRAAAALLRDGQAALDRGSPQEAIEIWSRVFAIDQSNAEAGALIDRAKAAIEEQGRQLDDLYYRAVDEHEGGRLKEARALFEQVLAVSPTHQEARSYITEIDARLSGAQQTVAPAASAGLDAAHRKQTPTRAEHEDIFQGASVPLAHPAPGLTAHHRSGTSARESIQPLTDVARIAPAQVGGFKRLMAATAGLVVVLGAGLGAYFWLGRENGSMSEARATVVVSPKPPAPAPSPGKRPPPPQAAEMQVVPGSPPKPPEPEPAPVDVEDLKAQSLALTREGREHFQQRHWAEAVFALKKAAEMDPIDFEAQDLLDKAMFELEKQAALEREMSQATRYVTEGDYASALQKFYRLQLDHPEIKVFDTYIRNCWFNWGVTLMQAGEATEAVEKFDETLGINPQDHEATRAREVARRYKGRQRDSVLDSFAATLSLRQLDQR